MKKIKNPLISLDIAITLFILQIRTLVFVWATGSYIVSVGYTSKFS